MENTPPGASKLAHGKSGVTSRQRKPHLLQALKWLKCYVEGKFFTDPGCSFSPGREKILVNTWLAGMALYEQGISTLGKRVIFVHEVHQSLIVDVCATLDTSYMLCRSTS